jgi:tungstate transport system ATP-binding protein
MLFELNQVVRIFGGRTVLAIDSLSFQARRIHALIGPNGAGKTTLLNQLAFLDQPSSGEISFKSAPVTYDQAALTRLRRQVVMVDQSPILFSGTVWKNIEFGLKVRKVKRQERVRRVEQALERVTLSDFAHRDVHGLSGGEVKRVALARALALDPEVLLCDEPTANVDREHQEIILKILSHANSARNTTIIFSTHYLSQSRQLAHQTLLLQNGRLSKNMEENLFQSLVVRRGNELRCLLGEGRTLLFTDSGGLARENRRVGLHIDPQKIELSKTVPTAEQDDLLKGTVISVAAENNSIRIHVDIGLKIQVLVSKERYLSQPFQVLQQVGVRIPQQAVELMP